MKSVWLSLPWLILLSGNPDAKAGSRPTFPDRNIDKSADFFQDRLADKGCQAELQKAREALRIQKEEFDKERKKKKDRKRFLALENKWVRARKAFLKKLEQCGECATAPVETSTVFNSAFDQEHWYISDGSCRVPSADPKVRADAFDRMVDFLTHIKRYPKKNGGFHQILEAQAIDAKTFRALPEADLLSKLPDHMILWVRGQESEKETEAYWYVIQNKIQVTQSPAGLREFTLRFKTVALPSGFHPPAIFDATFFGELRPTEPFPLTDVIGMWYLNSDGDMRYFTAAAFGLTSHFIGQEGRDAGLNAIYQVLETGLGL